MTRRDFQTIADAIKSQRIDKSDERFAIVDGTLDRLSMKMADVFETFSYEFDRMKFLKAAGMDFGDDD